MHQTFFVRELNGLGDLADEIQSLLGVQILDLMAQEMVETYGRWVVLEDERWAKTVLFIVDGFQNPRMGDALEDLELAACRPKDGLP